MNDIYKLITDILAKEGGYIDHPKDRGGPTNYGITIPALNEYTGRNNDRTDIKLLTEQSARCIYRENYYRKPGINKLAKSIQPIIFDMAVNQGPKTAVRLLQSQLFEDGYQVGKIDGKIGPLTIALTSRALSDAGDIFINRLIDRRIDRYRAIVKHDPGQAVFEKGWIARAETFRPEATT